MSTPDRPAGLRERKKQRTREEISSAAVRLVVERGLAEVRVEDICEEAAVGRSTFFRYFDSKENAFVEGVLVRRVDSIVTEIARRPVDERPFDALEAAALVVAAQWKSFRDDMLLEARLRSESAAVRAWAAESAERWTSAIATAVAPRVGGDDERAAVLAAAFIGTIQVGYEQWVRAGAARDPRPILRRCFRILRDL